MKRNNIMKFILKSQNFLSSAKKNAFLINVYIISSNKRQIWNKHRLLMNAVPKNVVLIRNLTTI